jgi:hypothetical protein
MDRLGTLFFVPGEKPMPPMTERVVARGPVKSKGPQAINREIDAFKAVIDRSGSKVEEACIAVLAPGSAASHTRSDRLGSLNIEMGSLPATDDGSPIQ